MSTALSSVESSRAIDWSWRVIIVLVSLPFLLSAGLKLSLQPAVVTSFTQAGIPKGAIVPIGLLEAVCVLLYALPRTAVLGTFLLTGYLGGAIVANIITRNTLLLPIALGLLAWLGTWLRVPELRALLPLRAARSHG